MAHPQTCDLNRLPANQRHKTYDRRRKRYEKPLPGHQVQIDVKFIEPVAGAPAKKYYQYTAIDDYTCLRVLRIYPRNNQVTAIQFLDHVLEKLPFQVERSKLTMAPSSRRSSTGTSSTEASATSTSNPALHA